MTLVLVMQGAASFRWTSSNVDRHATPLLMHESGSLEQLEQRKSERWNRTGSTLLVLGQKARRDFGVYAWAFGYHRFKLVMPPLGVVMLSSLDGTDPSMASVGGLLCHSLFLSNCVRRGSGLARVGDAERVYGHIRGRKINRLAAVRQVLSTKDGLCATLRASQLSAAELYKFTFPCWVLPQESQMLARHLLTREGSVSVGMSTDASDEAVAAAVASAAPTPLLPSLDTVVPTLEPSRSGSLDQSRSAPPQAQPYGYESGGGGTSSTAAPAWPAAWIVKPAHGSQGQGIRVYNSSAELHARLRSADFARSRCGDATRGDRGRERADERERAQPRLASACAEPSALPSHQPSLSSPPEIDRSSSMPPNVTECHASVLTAT